MTSGLHFIAQDGEQNNHKIGSPCFCEPVCINSKYIVHRPKYLSVPQKWKRYQVL